jgi:hypothetical protein
MARRLGCVGECQDRKGDNAVIETSTNIIALTAAILKVQGELSGVKKDGKNPHFKSNYATLENVIDTARPALQAAKIVFVQAPGQVIGGAVEVTTMLVHESGEWMRSTLHVPLGKVDPQGVGSAITYGLRYSLMAMLGLPPTDDDGEAATVREPAKRQVGINSTTGMATAHSLKKDKGPDNWDAFQRELLECETVNSLAKLAMGWSTIAERDKWPGQWRDLAREEINKRRELLINGAPDDDVFPGDRPSGFVNTLGAM